MAPERTQKIEDLRSLYGASSLYVDITKAELSDEVDFIHPGDFKTKLFNMAKAKTLADTFDSGKLNKATFMIRSKPRSLSLEKRLQYQLANAKNIAMAVTAFNTIA